MKELKDLTAGIEAYSSEQKRTLVKKIVRDLRDIMWLPCWTYQQARVSYLIIELCVVALCKTFKVGDCVGDARARHAMCFFMPKSKNIQNLFRTVYAFLCIFIRIRTRFVSYNVGNSTQEKNESKRI